MSGSYWHNVVRMRVSRRRSLAFTAGWAAAAALLAACGGGGGGSGESKPKATAAPAGQAGVSLTGTDDAKRGGTFGTQTSNQPHLNMFTTANEYASAGGQFVYDHLISSRSNENAPWVAEAAEGLEIAPDGITYTFKLRPGMTYHNFPPVNGRAVKAEDMVKVHEYLKTLTGSENAFQNDHLDKSFAPDDRTVVYKMQRPTAYLFTSRLFAHPNQGFVPAETFDKLETARQIGSGPFMLDNWVVGQRYHYVRFDKYHSRGNPIGTMPYLDARDAYFLLDSAAQEAAFRSAQLTIFASPPPGVLDNIVSSMGSQVRLIERQGLAPFTWNLGNSAGRGPWTDYRDIRVRKALYRLTNRQQFIDLVYNGKAELPTSILATGNTKAYQLEAKETAEYFKYDVAEARQLLSAAGWDPNKELLIEYQGAAVAGQSAEIIKQQWAMGGVKTRIQSSNPSELLERSTRGEYDFFTGGHPGYDSPQAPLSQNRSNTKIAFGGTSLNDPEIDAMITKAEQTADFTENVKLVKQILVELGKRYTNYYNIMTPLARQIIHAKAQNYEVELAGTSLPRPEVWFKS